MAVVLHCDLNNFYASVECVLNPALSHFPVAVAGSPRQRHGVVLAKNQIAKQMGIKTGDTVWQARQKCPNLICLPPQFKKYQEFSKQVVEIYSRFTDKIESRLLPIIGIDSEKKQKDYYEETYFTYNIALVVVC